MKVNQDAEHLLGIAAGINQVEARRNAAMVQLNLGERTYLLALLDVDPSPLDYGNNRREACREKLLASLTPEQRLELNLREPTSR